METDTWRQWTWKLPRLFDKFAACYVAPFLCVFGGRAKPTAVEGRSALQKSCWRLDVAGGGSDWEELPDLPRALFGPACLVV